MQIANRSPVLWRDLLRFDKPQIRVFHLSWIAFFLCFFAWFGIAPLMLVIKREFSLTASQVGNTVIASVGITILARFVMGWVCDQIGPRLTYSWLLVLGSIPVFGIALSDGYLSFLIFRLLIGAIGASFVITQYHTSIMFAPNIVGTANATSAGWGNLGGGVANMVMPLAFGVLTGTCGLSESLSWRLVMVIAGIFCVLAGIAYYCLAQDAPDGNFSDLRRRENDMKPANGLKTLGEVVADPRVWVLFMIYGCCFGVELTMINIGAMYFGETFNLTLTQAGLIAGSYGLLNLFARTSGGILGDRCGIHWGLRGRVMWLFSALLLEGIALMCFSQMRLVGSALVALLFFGLFVQMANGATFSVVPFIKTKSVGTVAGIVGAGGNVGAVIAGFMFKREVTHWPQIFLFMGLCVVACSVFTLAIRFSPEAERAAKRSMAETTKDSRISKRELGLAK